MKATTDSWPWSLLLVPEEIWLAEHATELSHGWHNVATRHTYLLNESFSMQHPKVVIIGAGSFFFGRKAIWQMVHSPHLQTGTLALVDTDADRLNKMVKLAQMVIDNHGVPLVIEATTDRQEVLSGADFVILSFAEHNAHYRGIDCEISAKYGIRMCSGDTIGPGGIFRTVRELPHVLAVCRDVERLAPDAWVINYINPAAVHGIAIKRYFPQLKSFALCDAQYSLREHFSKMAGVPNDERFVVLTAGPNHFTWVLKAEYDGQNVITNIMNTLRDKAKQETSHPDVTGSDAKGWLNDSISLELYETMGYIPTVVGHTKEYVRFYQGHNVTDEDTHPPLKLFEVPARIEFTTQAWQRVDDFINEQAPIDEFDTEFGPDPATDVIESMWAGLKKPFYINTMNNGAITNMADDAFLELYCDLDLNGPRPRPVGAMPCGIRAMCETILDTHELTVKAVHDIDRNLLKRALLIDPLTNSIRDTELLINDLFEAEHDAVDSRWFESVAIRANE